MKWLRFGKGGDDMDCLPSDKGEDLELPPGWHNVWVELSGGDPGWTFHPAAAPQKGKGGDGVSEDCCFFLFEARAAGRHALLRRPSSSRIGGIDCSLTPA